MRRLCVFAVGFATVIGCSQRTPARDTAAPPPLRINQLQSLGTHNSYHMAADGAPATSAFNYTLPPILDQLDAGVRQLEFDVHFDDDGTIAVYHAQIIDEATRCATLTKCLSDVKTWSDAHRLHAILTVLIDLKDPASVTSHHVDDFEHAVLAVWPRERLMTPDDVRGDSASLREAVTTAGWPTVESTRGRMALVMLNDDHAADPWLSGRFTLQHRLAFVAGEPSDAFAAYIKRDDPVTSHDDIRALVQRGFIVRTRVDDESAAPPSSGAWRSTAAAALASGAQLLSTDHSAPTKVTDYVFTIPAGSPSRCNPINAPAACDARTIEPRHINDSIK